MHTTFVIVAYRSAGVLHDCLGAIRGLPDSSALVVDNGSGDASVAIARACGAAVVQLGSNRGFAVAANAGAAQSTSPLVCFLNPDCRVDAATLAAARLALAPRSRACAVPDFLQHGGRVQGRQPGYTPRKLLADILETSGRGAGLCRRLRRHPRHHDHGWHWPLGTCLFVPADFFRAVGGFDPRYFMYMEDVEFGRSVGRLHGSVIALGTAVTHLGGRGSDVDDGVRLDLLDRGRLQYARRHHGQGFHLLLRLLRRRRQGPQGHAA